MFVVILFVVSGKKSNSQKDNNSTKSSTQAVAEATTQAATEETQATTAATTQATVATTAATQSQNTTTAAMDNTFIFSDSNSRKLTKEEVLRLSAWDTKLAKNEIYARHNRKFDNQKIQAYFDSQQWYHGTVAPSDFDEDVFNEYEKANVELLKKAEDYEKTVFKGLFYFNRYMEQLKSYEIEMGEAGSGTENENVVKIMTIHKSKGLEFSVVFVSGLSKKFNRMDLTKPMLCHPELGIGMECVNITLRFHHPSLMKKAIQEKVWKDTLEEEMRILYVAMTRAKRKLILTGTIKAQDLEAGLRLQINTQKWRATSAMDWLLPILADQFRSTQSEKSEEREGFLKNQETQKQAHSEGVTASWLKARLVNWEEILPFFEKERKQEEEFSYQTFMDTVVIPADVSMVEQSFSYEYPNRDATKWKRKYSVSELKTLSQTTLPEEESSIMLPEQNNFEEEVKMPEFLKEEKSEIAATARGTIIHKIMELLPFGQIQTKKQLFEWIDALKGTYPESEKISAKWLYRAIEAFLFSEIGEKLSQMDRQGNLRKEQPFTVGLPVSLMNTDTQAEDTVVVQGIIDICGEAEESLWLIDYKTDRIKEGEESLLLDRYGNQMLYYKAALEQILGKRVSESYLYSFSLKKFIPVNLQERSGENA